MIVKTISTQTKDENGAPLYFIQDLNKIFKTNAERTQYLQFLKDNAKSGLLKYEILADNTTKTGTLYNKKHIVKSTF